MEASIQSPFSRVSVNPCPLGDEFFSLGTEWSAAGGETSWEKSELLGGW